MIANNTGYDNVIKREMLINGIVVYVFLISGSSYYVLLDYPSFCKSLVSDYHSH